MSYENDFTMTLYSMTTSFMYAMYTSYVLFTAQSRKFISDHRFRDESRFRASEQGLRKERIADRVYNCNRERYDCNR
jgi:hypothetical protein